MKTTNHHPASKKTAIRKVSKKTLTKKKALPAKVSTKVTTKTAVTHNKVSKQALEFLDEAAALLRAGIIESAKTTENSRILVKKKAHHLLGRASKELSNAIGDGTRSLQQIIGKI
jgi:soluble cytochrome b562